MTARRTLALLMLALPGVASAQFPTPPAPPTGIPVISSPFDSTPRRARAAADTSADSLRVKRDLVTWAETDSVMQSLMEKTGYTVTRYQGNEVELDAATKDLTIDGHGAIQRGQMILVADTIFYSDTLHLVKASAPHADTITLRDPSQGQADLNAHDFLVYDLRSHKGVTGELATSSRQGGQVWFVTGHQAAMTGDTTGAGKNTSYAMDGSITSCDLTVPHYHFQASEIKVVSKTLMVARPAVLYVSDVPVLWLPFIFQDMRQGRHSGVLTPRFSLTDIVRTTPTYRRQIENVGYYFALNDYMDALMAVDWRSGADASPTDPGWLKLDGQWRFRWLDRFVSADLRSTWTQYTNGATRLDASVRLQQQFSQSSSINASLNYSSSTTLYRYDAMTVASALAAITSQLAYQDRYGPFAMSLGGTRTQYSGQTEVDYNFPNFSLSSQPITIRPGITWSPGLSITNTLNQNLNSNVFAYGLAAAGDSIDSVAVHANQRLSTVGLQTPFRFGDFQLPITLKVNDVEKDLPQNYLIYDPVTGKVTGQRTYASSFRTDMYWDTGVSLPAFFKGNWNVTPSILFVNADPGAGYWVRTQLSGGQWVMQSKTVQGGISVQPTFYGFYPGFGPFARIRHAFQPRIGFAYSPATQVSDAFLAALGQTRVGYLGGLERSTVTFQLLNTIEAKLKPRGDTTAQSPSGGDKVKLLNFNLSALTYDFTIARKIGRGITTPTFHWDAQSDMLPGFQISADYSLFQGDPISDTARFDPYRTGLSISFNIGRGNNPFAAFSRMFGGATPIDSTIAGTANAIAPGAGGLMPTPIAGPVGARNPLGVQHNGAWTLSLIFTSTRSRPVTGSNVRTFDPKTYCQQFIQDPITYDRCLQTPPPHDTLFTTTAGAPVYVLPPVTTLRANTGFELTPHWAVQWTTGYDFVTHKFADNVISLQRELHDWHAVFAFTQAPNGNFAFNFFISLNAEPDLKFDYNRRNYRPLGAP